MGASKALRIGRSGVAPVGIGVTIVEPGGARTEFRYGNTRIAKPTPEYDDNPAHAFLAILDQANRRDPGARLEWQQRIIQGVDTDPATLRMVLASQALNVTLATLAGGLRTSRLKPN
ncbi:MAG TPA: hypothetical protein VHX15_22280 [Frankiaceae bacterium]|nr:hypothetical protein [Frankiaceae bacterium]